MLTLVGVIAGNMASYKKRLLLADFKTYCGMLGLQHSKDAISWSGEDFDRAIASEQRLQFAMVYAMTNRCFFTTSTGYIGTGSQLARERDVIAVVQGASMPWILRPHGDHFKMFWAC